MPALSLDAVSKQYGEITALNELSISIEKGQLFGLLGPNGAGKTTTMEVLSGQIVPDLGSVDVLGVDPIANPTGVREQIGILPESESPPSFLTPREYLDFVASVRGIPAETVPDLTLTWAERLGFSGVLDTLSTDLSRGQQQKVMFAGAFFHEPSLVIIDEPLANLDPVVQERVKEFLREYQTAGNTILISTHDVSVAAELCSRVGILHQGELVADVRPEEFLSGQSLLDVFIDRVGSSLEAEVTSVG